MSITIASSVHVAGVFIFFVALSYFIYRYRQAGQFLGAFSTGISYKDFYAFLSVIVPLIGAASYFFISLGMGLTVHDGRTIIWLRYFDWSITLPLIVIGVVILTQRTSLVMRMIVMTIVFVWAAFIATITTGLAKITSFIVFALFFTFFMYLMLTKATEAAFERPEATENIFLQMRNLIIVAWVGYPVVWLASTNGYGLLTFRLSSAMFLVLDVFVKVGFAFIVLRNFTYLDTPDVDV